MKILKKSTSILFVLFSLIINPSCTSQVPDKSTMERESHEYFTNFRKENSIDGIAVALFTSEKVIWKECFGKSTYNKPINDSTLFGICSITKNITALTVMIAVQDKLVDLDVPIKTYLPDFRINSCYEVAPEDKITLRMMLSNTAGFTHEAPIGNNLDYRCNSKQEHWNSIRNTWLKFPVDTDWAYSSFGFDLAAEIIEKVSGTSFENYVKEKIFAPLDMQYSTLSDSEVLLNNNRTEGIVNPFVKKNHKKIPMIGAGAAYSNIDEMVKYIQFHLKQGIVDGNRVIDKKYLYEMYKINRNFYGLGLWISRPDNNEKLKTFYLSHSGGGFGFTSNMVWFPEYGIGCVILGNKECNSELESFVTDYILKNDSILSSKNLNIGFFPDFQPKENNNQSLDFVYPNNENENLTFKKDSIVGKYEILLDMTEAKWFAKMASFLGAKFVTIKVARENDKLIGLGNFGRFELTEYLPGLYFTTDGEAFDIRSSDLTFKNIKLRKYSDKQ